MFMKQNFKLFLKKYMAHTFDTSTHFPLYGQWSGFRPSALTRPRKAPARSINSSTEEQHCGFSQTVTILFSNCIFLTLILSQAAIAQWLNWLNYRKLVPLSLWTYYSNFRVSTNGYFEGEGETF